MPRKIYVASSWRNGYQPAVVAGLRSHGHNVYDFRNPPTNTGFSWEQLDDDTYQQWTTTEYSTALSHPRAKAGFRVDYDAMNWADTFVLVQPCGRSAHLELGWAVGQGKTTIVLFPNELLDEPELMVKMCDHLCVGLKQLFDILKALDNDGREMHREEGRT